MSASGTPGALAATAIIEFLEHDPRPTVVFEALLEDPESIIVPVYSNSAFVSLWTEIAPSKPLQGGRQYLDLLKTVTSAYERQVRWNGHDWHSFVIQGRWRIVACSDSKNAPNATQDQRNRSSSKSISTKYTTEEQNVALPHRNLSISSPSSVELKDHFQSASVPRVLVEKYKVLDWTRQPVDGMSNYVKFLRDYDWASTPLGPMSQWPSQLRQQAVSIMCNPDPRILLWGQDYYMLYNEACLPLIGLKHPHALGRDPGYTFAELWDQVSVIVDAAMSIAQVTKVKKMQLPLNRHGFLEDTYWSFAIVPVINEDGISVAAIDELVESTSSVVNERRMATVVKMGDILNTAQDLAQVWTQALKVLDDSVHDIPFALLYLVDEDTGDEEGSSSHSVSSFTQSSVSFTGKFCSLKGTTGITKFSEETLLSFNLSEDGHGYAESFRKAWKTSRPVLLDIRDNTLPNSLFQGSKERTDGVPCEKATVCPLPSLSRGHMIGFLVLGLHPKRPYDEDYQIFIRLLTDGLINSVAMVSLPTEQQKAQQAAEETATRHAALTRQLMIRTQEAERSEAKFTRMAQYAPVGMFMFRQDRTPIYLNDAYYQLTGLPRDAHISSTSTIWQETVHPDDLPRIELTWNSLSQERRPVTFEYRLKRPWTAVDKASGSNMNGYTWLLVNAFPELDDDESVKSIMGWLTDVSLSKWTEEMQERRLTEALEQKRQHENFIDMTSHEMRNPLSAIIQSSDGILFVLNDMKPNSRGGFSLPKETIEAVADAAQTIILCAQHQKRIVDDVLTLSKLDSNLMMITPDKARPVFLVEQALKMYEAELQSTNIKTKLEVGDSYKDTGVEEVILDPSRLLQVLINLLTNAIKFTKAQSQRSITISVNASYHQPSSDPQGITYIPQREGRVRPQITIESGEDIYIQFAVRDTGKGLSEEEIRLLFRRFSQASQKTSTQYGGSGLGLFISKELTELQGGQIGVASTKGKGSTFTFYVKAQRFDPNSQDSPVEHAQDFESPLHPPGMGHKSRRGSNLSIHEYPFVKRPAYSRKSSSKARPMSPLSPASPSTPEPLQSPTTTLHVLIVEDNLINQRVSAQQLRLAGCTVHVANNGLEALSFLRNTTLYTGPSPDPSQPAPSPALSAAVRSPKQPFPLSIILMDLEMPVMDGHACIRNIREMQARGELRGHVPVVAVTANARSEQIAAALSQGFDLVITKPFRIPDLVPQMEALVSSFERTNLDAMFPRVVPSSGA